MSGSSNTTRPTYSLLSIGRQPVYIYISMIYNQVNQYEKEISVAHIGFMMPANLR